MAEHVIKMNMRNYCSRKKNNILGFALQQTLFFWNFEKTFQQKKLKIQKPGLGILRGIYESAFRFWPCNENVHDDEKARQLV
jgi:hypothetical protein